MSRRKKLKKADSDPALIYIELYLSKTLVLNISLPFLPFTLMSNFSWIELFPPAWSRHFLDDLLYEVFHLQYVICLAEGHIREFSQRGRNNGQVADPVRDPSTLPARSQLPCEWAVADMLCTDHYNNEQKISKLILKLM